jgi:hypothetical protein
MLNRLPLPLRNFLTMLLWLSIGYLSTVGAYDIWRERAKPPSIFVISFFIVIAVASSWVRPKSKVRDEPVAETS